MAEISAKQKSVALEEIDIRTVNDLAYRKGLGARGFSAALRMIIREWISYQEHSRELGRQMLASERDSGS